MAEFNEGDYERSFPRETIRTKAEIMLEGQWHDCVITNISLVGARLYVRLNASRGMDANLNIREYGQFNATVAWCTEDEVGLKFEHDPSAITTVMNGLSVP